MINQQQQIIGALSLDLKRVALGLHRGSIKMADRFESESRQRQQEALSIGIDDSLQRIFNIWHKVNQDKVIERKAENILMISVLLDNYLSMKRQLG